MPPLLLIAGLLLGTPQSAPGSAGSVDGGAPPASSPTLGVAAPELAAVPGVALVGYPVSGRSARAIRQSINEGRPQLPQGEPFDARTTWRYQVRWMNRSARGCDPATVEVETSIVVILPELTSRDQLDRRERESWDRYFTALVGHEHNHVRIAVAGADQLRTHMRAAHDCAAMQAANARINAAVRAASEAYDENTRHGRSEGATYP